MKRERSRAGVARWALGPDRDVSTRGSSVRRSNGATVRFSNEDLVVDLTVAPDACRERSHDRGLGDDTVQWCIQPSGGIWLYATMFTDRAERSLRGIVEDLQVLNVRSPK